MQYLILVFQMSLILKFFEQLFSKKILITIFEIRFRSMIQINVNKNLFRIIKINFNH